MDKETEAEMVELLLGSSTGLAKQDLDSSPQNKWKTLAKTQMFI